MAPEPYDSCIRDEFEGCLDISELDLSAKLLRKIEEWHTKYQRFIPMDAEEKRNNDDTLACLDEIGLELSKEISNSNPGKIKIKYFSERKLRYL
jgi:hypothetical protein